jgi:hypothetical protein
MVVGHISATPPRTDPDQPQATCGCPIASACDAYVGRAGVVRWAHSSSRSSASDQSHTASDGSLQVRPLRALCGLSATMSYPGRAGSSAPSPATGVALRLWVIPKPPAELPAVDVVLLEDDPGHRVRRPQDAVRHRRMMAPAASLPHAWRTSFSAASNESRTSHCAGLHRTSAVVESVNHVGGAGSGSGCRGSSSQARSCQRERACRRH